MAWMEISYRCGHEGHEQIYGPTKQRGWIADQRGKKICPTCFEAAQEAQREAEAVAAHRLAEIEDLPALLGTPKQIRYAEVIRRRLLDEALPVVSAEVMQRLYAQASAAWWLDQRETPPSQWPTLFPEAVTSSPVDWTAIQAEIRVAPESAVTATVAVITAKGPVLRVLFPERREAVRDLLKGLGLAWHAPYWERTIGLAAGPLADRWAEVGHRLLGLGIPIEIADAAIRAHAIAGTFQPEQRRWIFARNEGAYAGWLVVRWPHAEDWYARARALPGAHWDGGVCVPVEQWEAVEAFAERWDFRLSPGALQAIAAARVAEEAMLRVQVPAVSASSASMPDAQPPVLAIPEEVTVDAAFRDDD